MTRLLSLLLPRLLVAAVAFGVSLPCVAAVLPVPGADAAVSRYDATRDAAGDIDRALAVAQANGRKVLLIVGGDWCRDCRDLDALFAANPALAALRDERYVVVKVFVGSENRNDAVLARYPKLDWVPTLIELDALGRAARVAPTTEFHEGEKLSASRIRTFLSGS